MKYLILFLIQLISIIGYPQSFLKTKTDSINILSAKWKYIKTIVNGTDDDVSIGNQIVIIKKDSSYQLTDNGKEILNGKWGLDTKKNIFTTNDNTGIKKYTILKLSNKELELEIIYDNDKILMIYKKEN